MFAKLFAFLFSEKEEPKPTPTISQRMEQRRPRDLCDNAQPLRTSKARSSISATSSARREDDILSNPLNPLNPIGFNSPVYYDPTPSHSSHSSSYDCGSSSSSSSYDSGSSSSCDSGSSSSGGGD